MDRPMLGCCRSTCRQMLCHLKAVDVSNDKWFRMSGRHFWRVGVWVDWVDLEALEKMRRLQRRCESVKLCLNPCESHVNLMWCYVPWAKKWYTHIDSHQSIRISMDKLCQLAGFPLWDGYFVPFPGCKWFLQKSISCESESVTKNSFRSWRCCVGSVAASLSASPVAATRASRCGDRHFKY